MQTTNTALPDVQSSRLMPDTATAPLLDWVGMCNVVIRMRDPFSEQMIPAVIDIGVNLVDPAARGIHMSRLFTLLQEQQGQALTFQRLEQLATAALTSQANLADQVNLRVQVALPVTKKSLATASSATQIYQTEWLLRQSHQPSQSRRGWRWTNVYSSTCPQSAALAIESIAESFATVFSSPNPVNPQDVLHWLRDQGLAATPHAQRSELKVQVEFAENPELPRLNQPPITLIEGIHGLDQALGTPTQLLVKRADEQAFAEKNAKNLMFCEDAVRRAVAWMDTHWRPTAYRLAAHHYESLHPHDAVAKKEQGSLVFG